MSFICAVTSLPSKSGEKPTRLVVETRPRQYTNFDFDEVPFTTNGVEIVREINVSKEGLKQLERIAALSEATQ